ncbi:hypothetical protein LXL04_008728 [Taraxacum kok-saghyz]
MRSPVNKQDFMKLQVENLKALLEIESQVPLQQQQLLYNGKEMGNAETLSRLGVTDGDLVMMVSTPSSSSSRLHISSKQGQQDYWTEGQVWDFLFFFLLGAVPVFQVLAVLLPSGDRAARDAVWCLSAAVAAYVGLVNHIIYKDAHPQWFAFEMGLFMRYVAKVG